MALKIVRRLSPMGSPSIASNLAFAHLGQRLTLLSLRVVRVMGALFRPSPCLMANLPLLSIKVHTLLTTSRLAKLPDFMSTMLESPLLL